MLGLVHSDRTFKTYGANNSGDDYKTWAGAYVILDGGYQHVQVSIIIFCLFFFYLPSYMQAFMNPMHDRFTLWEVRWSEWVESVRKDVECFFALIKCQWRWLRNKVEYHNAIIIEHAMRTACILHNMLLVYKEYDTFQWDEVDPDEEEEIHDEHEAAAEEELQVSQHCLLPFSFLI
jgi:hypothetical protein